MQKYLFAFDVIIILYSRRIVIMYYEPSKKTYYRFPSSGRLYYDFEGKYHFPAKSCHCEEDTHYDPQAINGINANEANYLS
jgi:hypothetical protein